MAIEITWTRVGSFPTSETGYLDAVTSGVCNIGGRLVMVAGSSFGQITGDVYYSDDNGVTWAKGSGLALFSGLGIGGHTPSDKSCGLLCYEPGVWLHPEDGDGLVYFGFSDAGGIIRSHQGDVGAGIPIFLFQGWSVFGRPCLISRKDRPGNKFAVWPGEFIYNTLGREPTGTLLLELSQAGATSITTAFLLNQLDPDGGFYATTNPDGSISWLWVTTPPRIGSSDLTAEGALNDGYSLFLIATFDGKIWRLRGPNQIGLNGRATAGTPYNTFTDAFFVSDGTLLCGVNVSGLSPCIFRSTDYGITFTEIVMPGNFYNYVPQGAKGSFVFDGLFVMTHCFCELDDGTILCGGGAPTAAGSGSGIPGHPTPSLEYHYPLVWRSTDKGLTWQNISLNVGDFGSNQPEFTGEPDQWESRILLALGEQAALLVCSIDGRHAGTDWTPFFITEDGVNFVKSMPPRVGLMAGYGGDVQTPIFWPIQATYANDGSIIVVMTDWFENVEIWRGTRGTTIQEHRAVGFMEQKDIGGATFANATIPEQELIRG